MRSGHTGLCRARTGGRSQARTDTRGVSHDAQLIGWMSPRLVTVLEDQGGAHEFTPSRAAWTADALDRAIPDRSASRGEYGGPAGAYPG